MAKDIPLTQDLPEISITHDNIVIVDFGTLELDSDLALETLAGIRSQHSTEEVSVIYKFQQARDYWNWMPGLVSAFSMSDQLETLLLVPAEKLRAIQSQLHKLCRISGTAAFCARNLDFAMSMARIHRRHFQRRSA